MQYVAFASPFPELIDKQHSVALACVGVQGEQ